jgi:hypothetical protein
MPIPGIIASGVIEQITGAYESIASATGTGSSGTITFSSIPATYQHLQIRVLARSDYNAASDNDLVFLRLNGNTGTNYAQHELRGDGSAVTAGAGTGNTLMTMGYLARSNNTANVHSVLIIDIHDYASSTKNTTVRSFGGFDSNASGTYNGRIGLHSGLFINTDAVTSLSVISAGGNFTNTTSISLYGIKA